MKIEKIFSLPTLELAKKLLGMQLITGSGKTLTSGMIVEVEAYHGDRDPASYQYLRSNIK